MADILLREEDLKFASTMVHTLNTILLTSSELFQLRNQLKDLRTPVRAPGSVSRGGKCLEAEHGSQIPYSLGTSRTPPGFPFLPQHVKGPPILLCKPITSPTCPPRAPRAPRQLPPPQETGDGGEHPAGPRWSRSCSRSKAAPGAAASSGGGHGGTPKTGVVSAPGGLGGGEVSPRVLVASFPNPPVVFFPQESRNLFCCLYRSWCHNPVTTVSLCFLTQNYKHAYDLIQKLYPSGGALPGCRRDGAVLAGCLPAPLPFFFLVM